VGSEEGEKVGSYKERSYEVGKIRWWEDWACGRWRQWKSELGRRKAESGKLKQRSERIIVNF
jgi:hypothetical protein